jgi:hypothetical protein
MCPALRTRKSRFWSGTNRRFGWAENAKISPAHAMTGSQAARPPGEMRSKGKGRPRRGIVAQMLVHAGNDTGART